MKRGGGRGIGIWILLAFSWSVSAAAVDVYVNDSPVSLSQPILSEDGSILVPIEEFGRTVGIEVAPDPGGLVLRWSGAQRALSADRYAIRDGIPYAMLEWLVGLVGGEVHRVGETWFVETAPATLSGLEATADRVVLRFDGFVPITVDESADGTEVVLRIHHCRSGVEPQWVMLGEGPFESLRLPSGAGGLVSVWITRRSGTALSTKAHESLGFYSFSLEADEHGGAEATIDLGGGLVLHERTGGSPEDGTLRVDWLYVEAWRDRYRLAPAFPLTGFETLASIDELAAVTGAVAAVTLGCSLARLPVDFLLIQGMPYIVDGESHDGLGLDLFGSWTYFSGEAFAYARHEGGQIPVDDVNRPLLYGEMIGYAPGYVGEIARGVPGSFTVIKARNGRVVSVCESPFVTADVTATLLVASGEAKARLSLVRLGDALSLQCGIGQDGMGFAHAFSAGPVLVDSGVPAVLSESSLLGSRRSWAVLATDWHGGLTLLTFTRDTGSEAEIVADLLAFFATMSVPVRDAIVLGRCGESAIVVRDGASVYRRGSGDPFALALCLVPLSP